MVRLASTIVAVSLVAVYGWFWCRTGACLACSPGGEVTLPAPAPAVCARCTLSESDRGQRRDTFDAEIRPRIEEIRELPGGFGLRFAPTGSIVADLASWIDQERTCCSFLEFRLVVERDGGPVWLQAEGDAAAKQFLQAALGLTADAGR